MMDNQRIYATKEFDHWAHREGLEDGEAFMIENRLAPHARTLEAGTGGGRLLHAMQARGFTDLHGFDFVPELIDAARKRDAQGTIDFQVQDATDLKYEDNSFDQVVYLQQVLSLVSSTEGRRRAVEQAYRILRPGGTAVVSLLANRARRQSLIYKPLLAYLRCLRAMTGSRRSLQYLPWLKLDGRWNLGALLDRGPYVYWFDEEEAEGLFQSAGFEVCEIASDAQIREGRTLASAADLKAAPFSGRLYLVCRK